MMCVPRRDSPNSCDSCLAIPVCRTTGSTAIGQASPDEPFPIARINNLSNSHTRGVIAARKQNIESTRASQREVGAAVLVVVERDRVVAFASPLQIDPRRRAFVRGDD